MCVYIYIYIRIKRRTISEDTASRAYIYAYAWIFPDDEFVDSMRAARLRVVFERARVASSYIMQRKRERERERERERLKYVYRVGTMSQVSFRN